MRATLEATETRQHQMMAFLNQVVRNPAVLQRYLPTCNYPSDEAGFGEGFPHSPPQADSLAGKFGLLRS